MKGSGYSIYYFTMEPPPLSRGTWVLSSLSPTFREFYKLGLLDMFFGIYEIVNPKEKGKNLNFVF